MPTAPNFDELKKAINEMGTKSASAIPGTDAAVVPVETGSRYTEFATDSKTMPGSHEGSSIMNEGSGEHVHKGPYGINLTQGDMDELNESIETINFGVKSEDLKSAEDVTKASAAFIEGAAKLDKIYLETVAKVKKANETPKTEPKTEDAATKAAAELVATYVKQAGDSAELTIDYLNAFNATYGELVKSAADGSLDEMLDSKDSEKPQGNDEGDGGEGGESEKKKAPASEPAAPAPTEDEGVSDDALAQGMAESGQDPKALEQMLLQLLMQLQAGGGGGMPPGAGGGAGPIPMDPAAMAGGAGAPPMLPPDMPPEAQAKLAKQANEALFTVRRAKERLVSGRVRFGAPKSAAFAKSVDKSREYFSEIGKFANGGR